MLASILFNQSNPLLSTMIQLWICLSLNSSRQILGLINWTYLFTTIWAKHINK